MFLAQMRKESCWRNTLVQPVRGMNQRSGRRSDKICEVYTYIIYCGRYINSGKNWWVMPKTKGTVYCQMGRSRPVNLYCLDLSFSAGLLLLIFFEWCRKNSCLYCKNLDYLRVSNWLITFKDFQL